MKFPIGIQTFEQIRTGGWAYVDKTAYVYDLCHNFKNVFLGRPRRFGKSLLLSTFESYFSGRRDLFEGLDISRMESDWNCYPVIHIDLNNGQYDSAEGISAKLNDVLTEYEEKIGIQSSARNLAGRFESLINGMRCKYGREVVILVDEYDKPLLEAIGNPTLQKEVRNVMKPFYGCLKTCDKNIRFVMLTGVTKYGKLSVFSDLNNIHDISLDSDYAAVCGITQDELFSVFSEAVDSLAAECSVGKEEMLERLRLTYDSYRFSRRETRVYNPYSLLSAFASKRVGDFWFMTGTPSYLVKLIKNHNIRLNSIEGTEVSEDELLSTDSEYTNAIPILYQCGYLTIKHYDPEWNTYTLGYPNEEVRRGFMRYLLPVYTGENSIDANAAIKKFIMAVNIGDVDGFLEVLSALIAGIPYGREKKDEFWFRDIIYIIFKLVGFRLKVEEHISTGRLDFVIETPDYVYIMEFKVDRRSEEALAQIKEKGYDLPYRSDNRTLYLIGINYDTKSRTIDTIINTQSSE